MKSNIQRLCQTICRPLTFNMALPVLLLLFSFKPGADTPTLKLQDIRKEVKIESPFQSIRIDGNISVVLSNAPTGKIIIIGKEKDVNRIRYSVVNNKLIIDAQRKNSFADLTVYLSATTLQSIQVNGDVNLSSNDILNVDGLRISLNGSSSVKVRTTGKLSFDTPYEYDLLWETPNREGSK